MLSDFVQVGQLTIIDANNVTHVYGPGGENTPFSVIRLTDSSLNHKLFFNPELYAGEAYMNGTLICEQGGIRGLLEIFAHNRVKLRKQPTQKVIRRWTKRIKKWQQKNKQPAAQKNVQHHYDISNDFYQLFLDDDMNYSCAYYENSSMTLEQAQTAKKLHIASKLNLRSGNTILDIGCGWGSMAIFLAENFGCKVIGVTLSKEQQELAMQRVQARGLTNQVDIQLKDYRNVDKKFDRIVSIGMFEHVGVVNYLEYFRKIKNLLNDDGCALVHSIGRKGGPGNTGAWIRKYIFPGGYSPSLSETFSEIEKAGLWVTDCEILRMHYAETLLEWEKRFQNNREQVLKMFDDKFCRMWEFYLIVSEFSFRHGKHMNFQIQLTKNVDSLPYTRDYIGKVEHSKKHLI